MQCRNQKTEIGSISDVITRLQSSNSRSEGILPIVKREWINIVGSSLASISEPIAIYYNVLVIELVNSEWQKIWEDNRQQLLKKLTNQYPWMAIQDLRLVYTGQSRPKPRLNRR